MFGDEGVDLVAQIFPAVVRRAPGDGGVCALRALQPTELDPGLLSRRIAQSAMSKGYAVVNDRYHGAGLAAGESGIRSPDRRAVEMARFDGGCRQGLAQQTRITRFALPAFRIRPVQNRINGLGEARERLLAHIARQLDDHGEAHRLARIGPWSKSRSGGSKR
jgi:hypothetical protein